MPALYAAGRGRSEHVLQLACQAQQGRFALLGQRTPGSTSLLSFSTNSEDETLVELARWTLFVRAFKLTLIWGTPSPPSWAPEGQDLEEFAGFQPRPSLVSQPRQCIRLCLALHFRAEISARLCSMQPSEPARKSRQGRLWIRDAGLILLGAPWKHLPGS